MQFNFTISCLSEMGTGDDGSYRENNLVPVTTRGVRYLLIF